MKALAQTGASVLASLEEYWSSSWNLDLSTFTGIRTTQIKCTSKCFQWAKKKPKPNNKTMIHTWFKRSIREWDKNFCWAALGLNSSSVDLKHTSHNNKQRHWYPYYRKNHGPSIHSILTGWHRILESRQLCGIFCPLVLRHIGTANHLHNKNVQYLILNFNTESNYALHFG